MSKILRLSLFFILIFLLIFSTLRIKNFYNEQNMIGNQRCEEGHLNYAGTKFLSGEFKIICYNNQTKDKVIISKIDNEWGRIS